MSHDPSPLIYLGTQNRESMTLDAALAEKAVLERARHAPPSTSLFRTVARTGAAAYVRSDPLRAMLIAAGAGALLMTLAARFARSGARAVYRKARS